MNDLKPCFFVGASKKDITALPCDIRTQFGHSLYEVQLGLEPFSAKALHGFGGRSVLELVEDYDGNTYRAVYTCRFSDAVYVLHVFQKKSKKAIATPKHEIDLIKVRLKSAEAHYKAEFRGK
jgi:phage-related protein